MTREELESIARKTICRWADKTKPRIPGKPKVQVVTSAPLEHFPVSYQLLAHTRKDGYIYLLDAQEVLDFLDAIDQ